MTLNRHMNPANFMKNEETGQVCIKCGAPMICVEWDNKYFAGCSQYFETGCRSSQPLPKTKPLLNARGAQIHPQAVENANEFGRMDELKRRLDDLSDRLNAVRSILNENRPRI